MNAIGRWFAQPAVVRIAQLTIGLVFLIAALGKIGDLQWFAQQVHNYRLAPVWGENLVAIVLPWIELLAGLALVLGTHERARAGAFVTLTLMLVFSVGVAAAWARGLDFNCGCFGKAGATAIGARKFLENLGLTALAGIAFVRPRRD